MSLVVVLATALAITGLFVAPGAGAEYFNTSFTVNPTDAIKNQVITGSPLNPAGPNVAVQVSGTGGGYGGLTVTLELVSGPGFATTGSLSGNTAVTDGSGLATFPALQIGEPNEATLTDYEFQAVVSSGSATSAPPIGAAFASAGAFSNPFDIWDVGCRGSGCSVALRGGLDVYTTTQNVRLTASVVSASTLPGLRCRNQTLVFTDDVFVHETSGSGPVGLVNHVTFGDLGGGGGGGAVTLGVTGDDPDDDGARIKWCVGTKTKAPWVKNGAPFVRQDTNGDGTLDLYVGSAPKCPKKNPRNFAPCIVSRQRDGSGGFFLRGWLPGGDPPRRT